MSAAFGARQDVGLEELRFDLILPLDEGAATFDGRPAGWCVYPPGSAHRPTVAQGRALVLYLLPEGQIQFTKAGEAVNESLTSTRGPQ